MGRLFEIEKRLVGNRTQTFARFSGAGREAVDSYWQKLETLHKRVVRWMPRRPSPLPAG